MNGKNLVLTAIRGEATERTPWVPFCGVHCGSLVGASADKYLTDTDTMVAGLERAIELYRPDGMPVIFDLQLEAEIFGCQLHWNSDNPPSVMSHPLEDGSVKFADLKVPTAEDGRLPIVVDAIKRVRAKHPDIALYGLITGPFTLGLHLLGTEIFMQMFDDEDAVIELMEFCAETGKAMSKIFCDAGCDVIAVVDPMTSQIGPDQFEDFCTKPLQTIFDYISSLGKASSLFVCGHAQKNIEVMCETHCDNISIDENIPLDYVRDICRKKGISFGGNLQLTVVMLLGDENANKINAYQCLEVAGSEGGFLLAPGCDIAYATPPENIIAAGLVAQNSEEFKIAEQLAKNPPASEIEKLDLENYLEDDKLKIDIITLDSLGCAPCQYMVAAAEEVAKEFGDKVVVKEHKIKTAEGLQMMATLGVSNIPTLCMDKEVVFISSIPNNKALAESIAKHLEAKGL